MKILAVVLLVLSAFGFKGNYDFMADGGLERAQTQSRTAFVIGMYSVPTALLVAGVGCGVIALNQRKSKKSA